MNNLFDEDGIGDLVPDTIPQWLTDMVKRSQGRDLNNYKPLNDHFKSTEVYKSDKFDRKHFVSMRENVDDLHKLAVNRFVDDPSWYDLIQDEYLALYKAQPKKNKQGDMKPTHRINHATMSKATEQRDWSELRTYTELDQWASAMAAVEFGLKLADIFDELKELRAAQDKMVDSDKNVERLIQELKEIGPEGEQARADELLDELEQAIEEFGEAMGGITEEIKRNGPAIRKAAKGAAEEGRSSTEGLNAALELFGTEPGELQRMPAEARLELARRIARNRNLKDLAEKVGRFVRLAMGEQARKIIHGSDEIHDIELGSDIHRVLPSELMSLADPDLEMLFLDKFANNGLLQYQLRGTENVGRGAIICMIDSSGSMSGSRDTWAKAVGIALLNIANRQNRDFYGIVFSSAGDKLLEWHFPKGKASPSHVLDFAEAYYGGGTDFMKPISRGVEVLTKQFDDNGSMRGDLVLVTDGECDVDDKWKERFLNSKREIGYRMYSCLIGAHPGVLKVLSDQVYNITDLARGDDVTEMFSYV